MKRFIFTIFLIYSWLSVFSQQEPQFTLYMFNKASLNPAAVGSEKAIKIIGGGRWQWIGFKDDSNHIINPRNYYLDFETPLYMINSGIGTSIKYGKIGFETNINAKINYAYHVEINRKAILSFGFSFNYLNKSIDFSQFFFNDPLLGDSTKQYGNFYNFGFGIYYNYDNNFYAGFSVNQLWSSKGKIGGIEYNLVPHYYFMAGYDFHINKRTYNTLVLSTGILLKTNFYYTQFEVNAILYYKKLLWVGLMYRVNDAVGVIGGVNVDNLSIGISYEYTTSSLHYAGSNGSPEFFIRYLFPIKPKIKMWGCH